MTIRNRLTLWFVGVTVVSLAILAGTLHYEWTERQYRRDVQHKTPEPVWEEVGEIVLVYSFPTLVMLIGGWVLLRKALAPVADLTRAVQSIHLGNLKDRLPRIGSGDELDRLTDVFNDMIERLDKSFDRIREFTLSASHELKTPLTVLRAEIETALRDPATPPAQREIFADQLEEITRLAKIVDGLTFLAKADAGQHPMVKEPVRLDDLVRDSFADAQQLGHPASVSVELASCDETIVQGDRHRLKQLLLNLTDNAIKYNEPNGTVTFNLKRVHGAAELVISNTGPGIAPEKLPRVFERFYRGDPSHNNVVDGCGLGLSLVQSIVQSHSGTVQITSQPGKLTTVTVKLPAQPPERPGASAHA